MYLIFSITYVLFHSLQKKLLVIDWLYLHGQSPIILDCSLVFKNISKCSQHEVGELSACDGISERFIVIISNSFLVIFSIQTTLNLTSSK